MERDDLRGMTVVHISTGSVRRIARRKEDDSGWWLYGNQGGLCDSVIEDGTWVPLPTVLAFWRAGNGRSTE